MGNIRLLDEHMINRIAAGEVVERPASVVKELVENSIDADATSISVNIVDGGKRHISIVDNGMGMDRDDASNAFIRHATSKIFMPSQLDSIDTLGFRGEALASIAEISQTELLTRKKAGESGTKVVISGGTIDNIEEYGCPDGTTININNLFYNAPARLKFLKSNTAEASYITEITGRLILTHPEISIRYKKDEKIIYNSTGDGRRLSAIASIYGSNIRHEIWRMEGTTKLEGIIKIDCYLGKPTLFRGNRSMQNFIINGRIVKNALLTNVIEELCRPLMMTRRFPWVTLYIDMPYNALDVNVHPSKTEIRFKDEDGFKNVLLTFLSKKMEEIVYMPDVSFNKNIGMMENDSVKSTMPTVETSLKPSISYAVKDTQHKISEEPVIGQSDIFNIKNDDYNINKPVKLKSGKKSSDENHKPGENITIKKPDIKTDRDSTTISFRDDSQITIIGQAFSTYILAESNNELFIIDQHAAHERLVFDSLMRQISKGIPDCQQLLMPYIINATEEEIELLDKNIILLDKSGFDSSIIEGKWIIKGVPAHLVGMDIKEFAIDFLEDIKIAGIENKVFNVEKIIMMACKKAVKAGSSLSDMELNDLVKRIKASKTQLTCPHGRPIALKLGKSRLESMFKRI